jgi:hypothetical protein
MLVRNTHKAKSFINGSSRDSEEAPSLTQCFFTEVIRTQCRLELKGLWKSVRLRSLPCSEPPGLRVARSIPVVQQSAKLSKNCELLDQL